MSLDVAAVQRVLAAEGLDGWLLYDFHGSNPIAARLAGLTSGAHMTTRRWYYLVPAEGSPRGLVHAIERHNLDALAGAKQVYAGRDELKSGLDTLLRGVRRLAMEYSPDCAIPYLSRVDAGTAEDIRGRGIEIVSSGDLVQRFEAAWSEAQLNSHRLASESLYRIKDRAFEAVAKALRDGALRDGAAREGAPRGTALKGAAPRNAALRDGTPGDATGGRQISEYDLQQQMVTWFEEEGLVSDSAPVVAVRENAGNPHYLPTADSAKPITADNIVLLDLWGKRNEAGAVFADITWVGFSGRTVPERFARAFDAAARARDAAVDLVQQAARQGRDLRGWEVDRAASEVLRDAGYASHILHRTGHSLGEAVHGNGVHMDDYETHDDRRILPGTGFTVEPGLYFEDFGVRTEINVFRGERDAVVTGPCQSEIVALG